MRRKGFQQLFLRTIVITICLATVIAIWLQKGTSVVKVVAPDGPYRVGVRIEHVAYQDRTIPVMFWYPARVQTGEVPYSYPTKVQGSAVLEAERDRTEAPYPLILFSHGFSTCGFQSVFFTENLASHGYVVAAPDYKDAMVCKIEGEPTHRFSEFFWYLLKSGLSVKDGAYAIYEETFKEECAGDLSYRAIEAGKVLDQAIEWNEDQSFFLNGMIDPEQVGATGHSLGGYTSLMIGGMPFLCDQEEPPEDCDPDLNLFDSSPCCNQFIREMEEPFQLQDPRVKAILPLGTPVIFPNIETGAAELKIPIMVITGEGKRLEVPWEPIRTLLENAPPPKYLVRLKKTDHVTLLDGVKGISSPVVRLLLPGFRFDYKEKAQAYMDYSVAFFDLSLKAKREKASILQEPSNRFVELWSEAK